MKQYIQKLMDRQDLSNEEAVAAMTAIMSGEASPSQIAGFLVAMRMKGETVAEITGFASVMRERANRVLLDVDAIDIVGTGGDGANTFNISTASAFVVAAAGMPVAKHGNRAASSRCGTADVLEALGANISLTPEQAAECVRRAGICFMFAQTYHQSMKHVAGPRKDLGVRTIFNLLGPLSNPAFVPHQLLGVATPALVEPLAEVLGKLGVKHAVVVCSEDGLDEISIAAPTRICDLRGGKAVPGLLRPEDFGFVRADREALRGGDAMENAQILKSVLSGEAGPKRDVTAMNAGAALYAADKAASIAEGVKMASAILESGAALEKMEEFVRVSNAVREEAAT